MPVAAAAGGGGGAALLLLPPLPLLDWLPPWLSDVDPSLWPFCPSFTCILASGCLPLSSSLFLPSLRSCCSCWLENAALIQSSSCHSTVMVVDSTPGWRQTHTVIRDKEGEYMHKHGHHGTHRHCQLPLFAHAQALQHSASR